MDPTIIIGGGLLLLLMGGKKKKKKRFIDPSIKDVPGDTGELGDPKDKARPGGGGFDPDSGGGRGTGRKPPKLKPDAIWVSPDCKEVYFGDDRGDLWWSKYGEPAARKFIAANYFDPYEIARDMILPIAPCAQEFPIMANGLDIRDAEFKREMFSREFTSVYYLIQFIFNRLSTMMDGEEYTIQFNDDCDVVFVGEKWLDPVAYNMANFYRNYMYPNSTDYGNHQERFPTWAEADVKEAYMSWWDNIATAIIHRMTPVCAEQLVKAFKEDPYHATAYLNHRPGLKAIYHELVNRINAWDDRWTMEGEAIAFNKEWEEGTKRT